MDAHSGAGICERRAGIRGNVRGDHRAAAVTAGTLIARVIDGDPLVVAAWQLLLGGAVLALVAAVVEGAPAIEWTARFVVALLYLSLVGTAATNVAWFVEVREAQMDLLTTWTLLVPVFGVTLSVVLLPERQSPWGWVGMAVVVTSMILLVAITGRRQRAAAARQQRG